MAFGDKAPEVMTKAQLMLDLISGKKSADEFARDFERGNQNVK